MSQPPVRQGPPILPPVNLDNQAPSAGFYNLPPINGGRPGGYSIPPLNSAHSYHNGNGQNAPVQQHQNTVVSPVQQQQQQQQAQQQQQQQQNAVRRLNIEDALTYLDQVKSYYQNNSEVYNNFLDIMKDFNTQKIDTPGVIDRVSTLFGNNPSLIQGFNTFLPPDYNILYSLDPNDPAPIKITTPSGTVTRGISPSYSTFSANPALSGAAAMHSPPPASAAAADAQASQDNDGKPQEPIEMDDAINYVNKIKIRFIKKPEIYNSFIEILQTFQREQKPIQEVFSQISVLFKEAPDLLDDFQKFLPDVDRVNSEGGGFFGQAAQPLRPRESSVERPFDSQLGIHLPPVGNFPPSAQSNAGKTYRGTSQNEAEVSQERSIVHPAAKRAPSKTVEYVEEIAFFNQVKSYIGNRDVYNNFLKLINLYSNEVIDKLTLVDRANTFIGENPSLFDWFLNFVGYDKSVKNIKNVEQKKAHLEYSLLQSCGPSYRKLPKSETFDTCSGRDEMCWNVLNDEWVGHPTWASEDSGFVAHKKNQYEEILFKIEEERHEYDYYLEANVRTIQTLETIAKQILAMTPEEKERFNLRDGLRSSSQTIYKKVIRKVYGDENGSKIIDAIQNSPIVAIPIVLRRLKLKDEEWKRAHREWNKVWREQEQKVYFKSLDHLGLSFRQTDKKYLNPKQLVTEINGLKLEEMHKKLTRSEGITGNLTSTLLLISPQLIYEMTDSDILVNILSLMLRLLNSYSTYSAANKEEYSKFLIVFMKQFFNFDENTLKKVDAWALKEQQTSTKASGPTMNDESDKDANSDDSESISREGQEQKKRKEEPIIHQNSISASSAKRIISDENVWRRLGLNEQSIIDLSESIPKNKHERRTVYNFFGNTDVYFFFRLITTLYERLSEIKKLSKEVNQEIKKRKETPFARSLDLVSHQLEHVQLLFSEDSVYEQTLELVGKMIDGVIDRHVFEEVLRQAYWNKAYKLFSIHRVLQDLLNYVKKLSGAGSVNSELLLLFEEDRSNSQTTVEKQISYENKVRSLIGSEENLFKISYDEVSKKAQISFIGHDDLILKKESANLELSAWQTYLSNYLSLDPTELDLDKNNESFKSSKFILHPFIEVDLSDKTDEERSAIDKYTGSELKVVPNNANGTFRIYYGGEEKA